jgi:hypothetical protein
MAKDGDGYWREQSPWGEMIHFNLAYEVLRISIIYLKIGDGEDEDDALGATMFSQICNLR